ncbi:hypothetical protein P22_1758 [Propionispora sp. 2/2-37]|uniref:DUF1848 domain-containing protein n=1 Tax=Propionispora sp. 2/2-37 TaxID=1677858 RepID=UPI0006BB7685|nr:DUF1848 domain-containing protein [Propionispora sp. 2/2-37]CUH95681.1 hypothetical protein P22_1758 [Propionispora sp. 2/2-37]
MIISASRRTDIPAFYSEWFLQRLREGAVLVPNPRRPDHYSRVELNPAVVDCIVFWTKNPAPMLSRLDEIENMGYPFYFQFTLTPYDRRIEQGLPPKNVLLETFRKLSGRLGPHRVVWRYDPVILGTGINIGYHLHQFANMAAALEGFTFRCIFSFLDLYPKVRKPLNGITSQETDEADMRRIAEGFAKVASSHDIRLFTCSEPLDLSQFGITHAACIDQHMVEEIIGCQIQATKDTNQRPACRCIQSIDIGTYDCCSHGCIYCYAASKPGSIIKHTGSHDPRAPVLVGSVTNNDVVTEREMKSNKVSQLKLF